VTAIRSLYVGRPRPGFVVALSVYLDDSREIKDGNGFHAIDGYVARTDFWEETFSPAWQALLDSAPHKLSEYKTSDCRCLTGEFKCWSQPERNAFAIRAVQRLLEFPTGTLFGVGAVIQSPEHMEERSDLTEQDLLRLALLDVVGAICNQVSEMGYGGPVHFICDKQPELQGKLADMWSRTVGSVEPGFPNLELSELGFEDSEKRKPIQAADILAYETRKDLRDRIVRPHAKRSTALHLLLNRHPHLGFYADLDILLDSADSGEFPKPTLLYRSPFYRVPPKWAALEDPRPRR
jgi:hypothetical protein